MADRKEMLGTIVNDVVKGKKAQAKAILDSLRGQEIESLSDLGEFEEAELEETLEDAQIKPVKTRVALKSKLKEYIKKAEKDEVARKYEKQRIKDRLLLALTQFSRKGSSHESSVLRDAASSPLIALSFSYELPERKGTLAIDNVCGIGDAWEKMGRLIRWLSDQFELAYFEDKSQSTVKADKKRVKANHERNCAYPDFALMFTEDKDSVGKLQNMDWHSAYFVVEIENQVEIARTRGRNSHAVNTCLESIDDLVEAGRDGVGQTIRWYCGHIKEDPATFLVTDGDNGLFVHISHIHNPTLTGPVLAVNLSQIFQIADKLHNIVGVIEEISGLKIGTNIDFVNPDRSKAAPAKKAKKEKAEGKEDYQEGGTVKEEDTKKKGPKTAKKQNRELKKEARGKAKLIAEFKESEGKSVDDDDEEGGTKKNEPKKVANTTEKKNAKPKLEKSRKATQILDEPESDTKLKKKQKKDPNVHDKAYKAGSEEEV